MKNFIQTNDSGTAKVLREIGFPELKKSNGMYTFANCGALTFAGVNIDLSKIHYTNVYTAS